MKNIFILLLILMWIIPSPVAAQDNATAWEENLDALVTTLTTNHFDPFTHISEEDFMLAVESLRADIPTLSDEQILMRMAALVALLGDSHTGLIWAQTAPIFPLGLRAFNDGIYAITLPDTAEEALGGRLVSINHQPIDEVIAQVQTITPHENDARLNAQLPNFLIRSEVLVGLGIIETTEAVAWEFALADGETLVVDIAPIVSSEISSVEFVFARGIDAVPATENSNGNYWINLFDDGTLYFKYNSAIEAADLPMTQVTEMLLTALIEQPVERMVIDLRDNTGGNSTLLDPLITALKDLPINREGKLFVIIGARTFSSGLLNAVRLGRETEAVLVGQPTGGSPNHFGEVRGATLPHFDLSVSYSTKYFETMPDLEDGASLMPDVLVPLSIEDYRAGIDPFYAAVLAYQP